MSITSTTDDIPPQSQPTQPGREHQMNPEPQFWVSSYRAAGKLGGKVALITGGDSGIGRAVAVLFAKEGADVVIAYLNEHQDARDTQSIIESLNKKCVTFAGDLERPETSQKLVDKAIKQFGKLNLVINNAAQQFPQEKLENISVDQWQKTFAINIHPYFYLTKAALPHLHSGDSIINTTSVTAYRGSEHLIDYSATKGAIVSFTRSLALQLAQRKSGIRVNGVAPGPIWTPLIPSSFGAKKVSTIGENTPLGRVGQPEEVAPAYVFLASQDASYITGQIIHVNGGEMVGS